MRERLLLFKCREEEARQGDGARRSYVSTLATLGQEDLSLVVGYATADTLASCRVRAQSPLCPCPLCPGPLPHLEQNQRWH